MPSDLRTDPVNVDWDGLAYTERFVYDASGNCTYAARAKSLSSGAAPATSAAVWAIKKFSYDASNNGTLTQWADGDKNEDNIFDNYASLTYL